MHAHALDHIATGLEARLSALTDFEELFGSRALSFLQQLPLLFQLYRRAPFDLQLPLEARRFAATAAIYIAEHQDFSHDRNHGDAGLIDDVWLAFAALPRLHAMVEDKSLIERHWRGKTSFADVMGLAHNVDVLREKVPPKVLESAARYLGVSL